ncbi:serine/threonine protein kinase [Paenibacillus wynnii]|uniref:serine/threonine protein kinase n=1 Tax=Paenibacillus wynnii TaxID=268407 RepID=UPI0027933CD5|nr:serine/threonine-protein kinase [Paenibacillus wynnii]MDQ0194856.1 serine/threonine-protein kinase [Paenibacillus wynnii]
MRYQSKLSAGQIWDGRYAISQIIGSGGMSHVHLAEDLRLPGKKWAIKECVTTGLTYGSLQAEAELLISLNHRRLPRIVDFYPPDNDGYSYLVMDYIEGITLGSYMTSNAGVISGTTILRFARQLLEVLQYLHGHNPPIVYRDLKPSNIMVTAQNELMLIDFGIARSYRSGGTEDTVKLGTVGFAAPEQYGEGQSGPLSDLYGLGALLLYMATGGRYSQWQGGMDRHLSGGIPTELIPVIQRLLRQHPEDRYRDAQSVWRALEGIDDDSRVTNIKLASDRNKPCVVTVLGVANGLGTTHTSLAVSGYLSRLGATAWVDLSAEDSPVYHRIRSMVEVDEEYVPGRESGPIFQWNGVDYGKRPDRGALDRFLDGDYRYVVMDLGVGRFEGAMEEFARSDIPILIASGADWRLEELVLWLRRSGLQNQAKWKVGLPMASRTAVKLVQSVFTEGMVYGLPLQCNPFKLTGEFKALFEDWVHGIPENGSNSKSKKFFQKKKS